ncbi:MAG: PEP-CTERM sorting domain-containing protein [Azonexus sp.]|nr:PEP-CTERM sorting domain-containing protein [Azonexus sp.]
MKKLIATALCATAGFASLPANALTVTFGGVNPNDGSFLTSALAPTNQNNLPAGIFVETFDVKGGCGLNSAALGVVTSGNFWMTTGASGTAAAPANDTTCYGSGPQTLIAGDPLGANTATIDFSGAAANFFPGKKIDYLGFYWGSIDSYNDITFYANGVAITISKLNGFTLNSSVLDGSDILRFGGNSGDRANPNTNRYVNMYFDENERFDKLVMHSSQYAMEIDNVVVRVAIPEPSVLLLIGTALLGLGFGSRSRKAK